MELYEQAQNKIVKANPITFKCKTDLPIMVEDVLAAFEKKRTLIIERFYLSSKGYLERFELVDHRGGSLEAVEQVMYEYHKPFEDQEEDFYKFLIKHL